VVALAVTVFIAAGCSSGSTVSDSAPPLPDPNQERVVFIALGGDETVNRQLDDPFRDAWTQRVFTRALPRSAVYVNFARPEATVSAGVGEQLPLALALDPTVATVWFGEGDVQNATSDVSFAGNLSEIVDELEKAGTRVLLLTRPEGNGTDARFAEAIQQVAATTAATVVRVPDGDLRLASTQVAIADAVAAKLTG
jgi:hypothetical protein